MNDPLFLAKGVLVVAKGVLVVYCPRRRCAVTPPAAALATRHAPASDAECTTTSTPLATLASRNTGSFTLQKHNNKSDTTNARQYMKDTDAYYKRKLMRLTKGDEKVVYLQGENDVGSIHFYVKGKWKEVACESAP